MKSNTKHLLYLAASLWIVTGIVFLYMFWPLISQEISYSFSKKSNNAPSEKVVNVEQGGGPVKYDAPNKIVIPKINVDAPTVEAASVDEKDVIKSLENGVVHYPNTALPGEVGNVFLTGHSSNYSWAKGSYNFVFSMLKKLDIKDLVYIYQNGYQYTYEVYEVVVVSPKEISVLAQGKDSIVSLMTCDPPGTTWKRRIVRARQINPDPSSNKATEFKTIVPQTLVGN